MFVHSADASLRWTTPPCSALLCCRLVNRSRRKTLGHQVGHRALDDRTLTDPCVCNRSPARKLKQARLESPRMARVPSRQLDHHADSGSSYITKTRSAFAGSRSTKAGRRSYNQGGWMRRMAYLVDPSRRKAGIPWWLNPVMVKEFRTRKFGRLHWLYGSSRRLALFPCCSPSSLRLVQLAGVSIASHRRWYSCSCIAAVAWTNTRR